MNDTDHIRFAFGSRRRTIAAYLLVVALSVTGLFRTEREIATASARFEAQGQRNHSIAVGLCAATLGRSRIDLAYNKSLLSAELLYASTIVKTDANSIIREKSHHIRIATYRARAQASINLAQSLLFTCRD